MKYKWKQYSVSIPIRHGKQTIINLIKSAQNCGEHELDFIINTSIFNNPYRKYRRGKNRCKRCGVKIK